MKEPRLAVYVRDWHPPGPYLEEAPGHWRYEDGMADRAHPRAGAATRGTTARLGDSAGRRRRRPAALRADDRRRGGGPRDVVGRRRAGPASDRRVQPGVRHSASRARTSRSSGCRRRCCASRRTRPHVNWFARLNDVAPDGTVTLVAGAGHERRAPDLGARAEGDRAGTAVRRSRSRCTSRRGSSRRGIASGWLGLQRPVADELADAVSRRRRRCTWAARARGCCFPSCPPGETKRGRRRRATCRSRAKEAELPGYEAIAMETPSALRGDLVGRPQPAHRQGDGRRDQQQRAPVPLGRGEEHGEDHARGGGREAREGVGARRVLDRGQDSAGRTLRWESVVVFSSDRENFHYSGTRKLFENGKLVREKNWEKSIPRDFQ